MPHETHHLTRDRQPTHRTDPDRQCGVGEVEAGGVEVGERLLAGREEANWISVPVALA